MALFQGLSSTWLREMPGYFCFFGGYEVSKMLLTPKGKSKDDLGKVIRKIPFNKCTDLPGSPD